MSIRTILETTTATFAISLLLGACVVEPEPDTDAPEATHMDTGKILLVASSPATATTEAAQGWPLGAWIAEVSHPYYELVEAGYEVEIVSTEGGEIFIDPYSDPRHESGYSADEGSASSS